MITVVEKPRAEQLVEVAAVGDDTFARSLGYYSGTTQLNPDPILRGQAGNLGIDCYRELIRKDAQIAADLRTRRKAIVGLDWEVVPASAEPAAADLAAWVGAHLEGLRGFASALYALTDAIGMGYAITEILWGPTGDGRIGIAALKSRHQRRFVFDAAGQLRLCSDAAPTAGTPVPARKFLIHTFEAEHENPYGTGVGQALYWYAWFSKHALKFWALYAEKFGAPTPVGKYPTGADDTAKQALLSALGALQQETAVVVPDTMTVEFLEAQRRGTIDTYAEFLRYLDQKKAQIVLGQTLTSAEGARSGSLALGQVHADVRQDILEGDAQSLADVLNGQLIPWLVDWNWPVAAYPQFVWKLDPAEDLVALATRDTALQGMGLPIPKSYVQRKYGIPEPTGEDDVLVARQIVGPVGQVGPGGFSEPDALDRIVAEAEARLRAGGR